MNTMKVTEIGHILNSNNISMKINYVGDDKCEEMEQIKIEVRYDDYGTAYVFADDLMELLDTLSKKMRERPLQDIYAFDEYNY